jgi:hypothetical protein
MAIQAFHITHDLEFDLPMRFDPNSTSRRVRAKDCEFVLYLSRSDEGKNSLADECADHSQALAIYCKPLDPRESGEVREACLAQPESLQAAALAQNFALINRDRDAPSLPGQGSNSCQSINPLPACGQQDLCRKSPGTGSASELSRLSLISMTKSPALSLMEWLKAALSTYDDAFRLIYGLSMHQPLRDWNNHNYIFYLSNITHFFRIQDSGGMDL